MHLPMMSFRLWCHLSMMSFCAFAGESDWEGGGIVCDLGCVSDACMSNSWVLMHAFNAQHMHACMYPVHWGWMMRCHHDDGLALATFCACVYVWSCRRMRQQCKSWLVTAAGVCRDLLGVCLLSDRRLAGDSLTASAGSLSLVYLCICGGGGVCVVVNMRVSGRIMERGKGWLKRMLQWWLGGWSCWCGRRW